VPGRVLRMWITGVTLWKKRLLRLGKLTLMVIVRSWVPF
jgi:hypothetical protein